MLVRLEAVADRHPHGLEGGGAGKTSFGEVAIQAAARITRAATIAQAAATPEAPAEKTEFDVILAAIGEKKVNVIKEVRAVTYARP